MIELRALSGYSEPNWLIDESFELETRSNRVVKLREERLQIT